MEAVTVEVSSDFQVKIPQQMRHRLGLQPGQKVRLILYSGRIEMVPVRPIRSLRGFLKGIDTSVPRVPDRI